MSSRPELDLGQCCARIGDVVDEVFASLDAMERDVAGYWAAAVSTNSRPPGREAVAKLQPLITERLAQDDVPINGCGIVFEPGAVHETGLILEWWRHDRHEGVRRLELDFNPTSERFYDYTRMSWFQVARDEGRRTVVGPYVDLHGSDVYVLTFASPLVVGSRFIGIVGADVPLANFERHLTEPLRRLQGEALLVTEEGRILATSSASWTPGTLFRRRAAPTDMERREVDSQAVSWSVIRVAL